ncbi:nol1 nop2 sun domain containing protein [Niveomyces insectorum RCEF 264]|uniref:Nol1 nop2 sun domain containing protein n=1 Tax=Niveomyces insectorum RCEF 264 TaxID=1081102 RepID=A0A167REF4_9HYPO|nr:nol1 nop2 sun domain containing protein [Niveomyces insectorum RCEF 264]
MSLYYQAAEALSAPASDGGNLKTRIFSFRSGGDGSGKPEDSRNATNKGNAKGTAKERKAPPAQVYALAVETCKWSAVLSEVVDAAGLLVHERRHLASNPTLALLLVHDLLVRHPPGIQLPPVHGLRTADATARIYVDEHVPDLVAVPLVSFAASASATAVSSSTSSSLVDLTRSPAYRSGALIFQDKASCFPAYLLDPPTLPGDSDLVDACAAPGNKTSHLAALLPPTTLSSGDPASIFAFEKDPVRAVTLQTMLRTAGALDRVSIGAGQDFLRVDPAAPRYRRVRALLLDPSCSGSGIVGRDAMPTLHLPKEAPGVARVGAAAGRTSNAAADDKTKKNKKRKRGRKPEPEPVVKSDTQHTLPDTTTTTTTTTITNTPDATRLAALASFQLALLLHAFRFPAARRITYSTCSVHAQENEQVVVRALRAAAATGTRWRLMRRDEQVAGLQAWPVRGDAAGAAAELRAAQEEEEGNGEDDDDDDDNTACSIDPAAVAEACIRAYPDDGRGVMGFFVAAFVREDGDTNGNGDEVKAVRLPKKADGPGAKKRQPKAQQKAASQEDEASDWSGFDD